RGDEKCVRSRQAPPKPPLPKGRQSERIEAAVILDDDWDMRPDRPSNCVRQPRIVETVDMNDVGPKARDRRHEAATGREPGGRPPRTRVRNELVDDAVADEVR